MSHLEKHNVFYISIETLTKQVENNVKMNYEHLGVNLHGKYPLCKLMFKKYYKSGLNFKVDKSSFVESRKKVIDVIISDYIIQKNQLGRAEITIQGQIEYISKLLQFADSNGHQILTSASDSKTTLDSYFLYLKSMVRSGSISQGTLHYLCKGGIDFLKIYHNVDSGVFMDGIGFIYNGSPSHLRGTLTAQPKEADLKYSVQFYHSLFVQLSNFLLNKEKFPFKIELPFQEPYYIYPSSEWNAPHKKTASKLVDIYLGKIKELDEIKNSYKDFYKAKEKRAKLLKLTQENNVKFDTKERLYLATVALKAYFMYFLSLTGMNDSTAATLPWDDDYELEKSSHSFKNIKYRAGNKPVEFKLQNKAINDFKKYLQLRKYILGNNDIEYLFFEGFRDEAELSLAQKRGSFSSLINTFATGQIDRNLPKVTSRQFRVNKTHRNIQEHGLLEAAELAQSSVSTVLKHYTGETEESSGQQMNDYFNHLNENIIFTQNQGVETNVGRCDSLNNPQTEIELNGIEIDCKKSEGCLFCEHYGCHADEIDIKKLYSLLYVINESKYVSKNEEHFLSVYGLIINRVNDILQYIKENSEIKLEPIKNDVFENENLNPYWEYKLNTLVEMGILV